MSSINTIIDYFSALRCYRCGNYIKEVALSKTGDEEYVYCRKCWASMEKDAAHRRECEKINAEC